MGSSHPAFMTPAELRAADENELEDWVAQNPEGPNGVKAKIELERRNHERSRIQSDKVTKAAARTANYTLMTAVVSLIALLLTLYFQYGSHPGLTFMTTLADPGQLSGDHIDVRTSFLNTGNRTIIITNENWQEVYGPYSKKETCIQNVPESKVTFDIKNGKTENFEEVRILGLYYQYRSMPDQNSGSSSLPIILEPGKAAILNQSLSATSVSFGSADIINYCAVFTYSDPTGDMHHAKCSGGFKAMHDVDFDGPLATWAKSYNTTHSMSLMPLDKEDCVNTE